MEMWKSSDHCSFTSSWECDHDPSYVASYCFAQEGRDWTEESSTQEDVPSSSSLECSQPASDPAPMELSCTCKPHQSVSIVGVIITSEAKTIECYSSMDGYLKSVRGTLLTRTQAQEEVIDTKEHEKILYQSVVKFDHKLNELSLKFLGLGGKTSFTITRLELVLTSADEQTPGTMGGINLTKVKGYLDSMGGDLPKGSMDLFRSVEQYQQTQLSGLGGLQAMFASLSHQPAGTQSPAGLSALLSMMPGTRQVTRSHDCVTANQNEAEKPANISDGAGNQSDRQGPLQSLLMAMRSEGSSSEADSEGENKDSMFEMLRGICGKVSEMRVDRAQPSTDDTEDKNSKENTPAETETSAPPGVNSVNLDALKSVFEQTAGELVRQSEERLKSYIDTRLDAMETRLNNKLDSMMQALQKNGHPVTDTPDHSQ